MPEVYFPLCIYIHISIYFQTILAYHCIKVLRIHKTAAEQHTLRRGKLHWSPNRIRFTSVICTSGILAYGGSRFSVSMLIYTYGRGVCHLPRNYKWGVYDLNGFPLHQMAVISASTNHPDTDNPWCHPVIASKQLSFLIFSFSYTINFIGDNFHSTYPVLII